MYNVSIVKNKKCRYPHSIPFSPEKTFPEFRNMFSDVDSDNCVYGSVRKLICNLGLDKSNYGTTRWNPFGEFVKKGNTVLIKPNLVLDNNRGSDNIQAVVTHASVLRPIIDYVLLALAGTGRIIIADAPQANADFNKIIKRNGLQGLIEFYQRKNINIELYDLRKNAYVGGFTTGLRKELLGDPAGYVLCNLRSKSFLQDEENLERLYGADFDRKFIVAQHTNGHKYLFSKSVLDADVVISVPKLKTHRKAGVTINCKNMVGANGDKNYLAHYRVGTPAQGGDEYPDNTSFCGKLHYRWFRFASDKILVKNTNFSRILYKTFNIPFRGMHFLYRLFTNKEYWIGQGDWHGNDTVWRMCLDLNQILLYCDSNGIIHNDPQRKYFSIVDGIVAGEKDGPLEPSQRKEGYLAGGINPFLVDYVCAYQMGFSPKRIPVIKHAMYSKQWGYNVADIKVCCINDDKEIDYRNINMQFEAQDNWKGYIER